MCVCVCVSGSIWIKCLWLCCVSLSLLWYFCSEDGGSAEDDLRTILQASYCGVRFLATVHVLGPEDLRRRPLYRRLMEAGVFENLICIEADRSLRCERVEYAVS